MKYKRYILILFILLFLSLFAKTPLYAQGVSLYLAPQEGEFLVGNTFTVSVYVNTKGNKINAVELHLKFPPNLLQVVSPIAGKSFISEWRIPPNYSNTGGFVSLVGGIPGGIVTSGGLLTSITFRAKSSGLAKVDILDSSKIFLANGKGSSATLNYRGGSFKIIIPPPEGPKIFSPTHPDPDIWYSDSNPSFSWEKADGVTDFSYTFSQNPKEIPDIVSEGDSTFKSYSKIPDGVWYFHLRQKKDGIWGRTSWTQVKIDTISPQLINLQADGHAGLVYFKSKDTYSGIDHYEISIINLNAKPLSNPFFIEASSPYKIPYNKSGKYLVIIRTYDKAGNFSESKLKFWRISPLISFIGGNGVEIKGVTFSWPVFFLILILFLFILIYLIFRFFTPRVRFKKGIKEIKEAVAEVNKIEEEEKELRQKREKFQKEKEELKEKL